MESTMTKELDVYTERDLSTLFGVSLHQIRKWRAKGRISPTGYTPGGKPVYSRRYVRDLLDNPVHPRFS